MSVITKGKIKGTFVEVGDGSSAPTITSGTGAPPNTAIPGSLYLRKDGTSNTTLYAYQNGSWITVPTGSGTPPLPVQTPGFTVDGQRTLNLGTFPQGTQPGFTDSLVNTSIVSYPGSYAASIGQPYQLLDATFGVGPEPYRDGFWVSMPGSVIRIQLSNKFITRIPLAADFIPGGHRNMWWDSINNKLYVADFSPNTPPGAAIWIVDTTPCIDAENNSVVSFPNTPKRITLSNSHQINDATNTTPIVISTTVDNNVQTGDIVTVGSVSGNTAADGNWVATRIDNRRFSLNGSVGNGTFIYDTAGNIYDESDVNSIWYFNTAPDSMVFDGSKVWFTETGVPQYYNLNPNTGASTGYQLAYNNGVTLNTTSGVVTLVGQFYGNSNLVGQNITVVGAGNALNDGTFQITSYLPPPKGNTASINALTGVVTLTGGSGFYPELVGQSIVVAGSTTQVNNGFFTITGYISPTSILYSNPGMADGPDANNGNIAFNCQTTAGITFNNPSSPDGTDGVNFASLVNVPSFPAINEIYFTKQVGTVPASLWLTDNNNPNIYQIDPLTGNVLNVITLGSSGRSMASTHEFDAPIDSFLYIVSSDNMHLSVVDMKGLATSGIPSQVDYLTLPGGITPQAPLPLNSSKELLVWYTSIPGGIVTITSNTVGTRWDGSGATNAQNQNFPFVINNTALVTNSDYQCIVSKPSQSPMATYSGFSGNTMTYPPGQSFIFAADNDGAIIFAPFDNTTPFEAWSYTEGSKTWVTAPNEPIMGPGTNTIYYTPGYHTVPLSSYNGPMVNSGAVLHYYFGGSQQEVSAVPGGLVQFLSLSASSFGANIHPPDLFYQVNANAPRDPEINCIVARHDTTSVFIQGTTTTAGSDGYIIAGTPTVPILTVFGQSFLHSNISGLYITISGAADPNNNGTFKVLQANLGGIQYFNNNNNGLADANNGSISWTLSAALYQLPVSYTANAASGTDGSISISGGFATFSTAATLPSNPPVTGEIITISGTGATATGSNGSIIVSNGVAQFSGSGFFQNIVGQNITISGAANVNNNGSFPVIDISGATVIYTNPLATTDTNNGAISWSWAPNDGSFVITGEPNVNTVFYLNSAFSGTDPNNGSIVWSITTPDGYACSANVRILASGTVGRNSVYSAQYAVDVANTVSPTQLSIYDPSVLGAAQFSFVKTGDGLYTLLCRVPNTTTSTYWSIISDISYLQTRS